MKIAERRPRSSGSPSAASTAIAWLMERTIHTLYIHSVLFTASSIHSIAWLMELTAAIITGCSGLVLALKSARSCRIRKVLA